MPWFVSPIPTTETSKEEEDEKNPTESVAEMREEAPNPVRRDTSKRVGVILDKFPKSRGGWWVGVKGGFKKTRSG